MISSSPAVKLQLALFLCYRSPQTFRFRRPPPPHSRFKWFIPSTRKNKTKKKREGEFSGEEEEEEDGVYSSSVVWFVVALCLGVGGGLMSQKQTVTASHGSSVGSGWGGIAAPSVPKDFHHGEFAAVAAVDARKGEMKLLTGAYVNVCVCVGGASMHPDV